MRNAASNVMRSLAAGLTLPEAANLIRAIPFFSRMLLLRQQARHELQALE